MAAGGFAPASGSATTQPKPARVTKKADEKSASKARTVLRVQANAQAAKAAKDDERQEKEIARMEAALKAAKAARAAAKVQHNAPSADENGSGGSDSGESDEDLAEGDDDDDLAGKSRGTDIAGYESSDDNQDGASSSVGLAHVSMRDRYAKAQPQQPLPPPPPARRSAARDAGRSSDDEHNWDAVEYLANKQRPSALPMAGPAPPGTMETAKLTAAKAVNSFTSVTHKLSMSQLARAALLVGADWWTSSTPTVPQAIFEAGVGSLVVDKLFSSALGTARTQVVGSVQEKATKALNPNALVAARDPEAVNKIVHDGPVLALGPQSPINEVKIIAGHHPVLRQIAEHVLGGAKPSSSSIGKVYALCVGTPPACQLWPARPPDDGPVSDRDFGYLTNMLGGVFCMIHLHLGGCSAAQEPTKVAALFAQVVASIRGKEAPRNATVRGPTTVP
ncbi:hypothetical protein BC828DRAFT_404774 [Blastocladiella britannica]|nr:hypothetical protein BC828DRAFT_404774 [Blastocladiella britannica]